LKTPKILYEAEKKNKKLGTQLAVNKSNLKKEKELQWQ